MFSQRVYRCENDLPCLPQRRFECSKPETTKNPRTYTQNIRTYYPHVDNTRYFYDYSNTVCFIFLYRPILMYNGLHMVYVDF